MEESLELEVLRENMNKAIRNKDGWLTHWYGSELRFRLNLIEELKRKREKYKQKLELLREKCLYEAEKKLILYGRKN